MFKFQLFPTPHETTYKTFGCRQQLREMLKSDKFPIPEAFQLIQFQFNEDSYSPINKTIPHLESEIESQLFELETIEKLKYIIQNSNPSDKSDQYLSSFLDMILHRFSYRMHQMVECLKNDKYSKELGLGKRREKRKRYRNNKRQNADSAFNY